MVFSALLLLAGLAAGSELRAGASAVNLEADDSMVIAGGIGPGQAKGQEGQLRVTAVVIEQPPHGKLALVACDVLFVSREFVDPALAEIETATGIAPQRVLVNATHTHHAPSVTRVHGYAANETFRGRLQAAIVRAVREANDTLPNQPARFLFHQGEEKTVGMNSRLLLADGTIFWIGPRDDAVRPTGPFDPQLPVLAFRGRDDNKLLALVFNHSTHTIGTRLPGVRSPSFYGLAAQELEQEHGGLVCFLEGASGSTHNYTGVTAEDAAGRIKQAVNAALEAAAPRSIDRLAAVRRSFTFKVRTFDEAIEDDKVASYCRKRAPAGADTIIDIFREMRRELKPRQGEVRQSWVQALRIGDVALVGVPAEFFTGLGLEIKRRSPFRETYVAELAGDWIGYLPDREAHRLGGYQTWMGLHSYAEIGAGEAVAEMAIELLGELKKQ